MSLLTNYELSIWTHSDTFIGSLKSSVDFNGQAYNIKHKTNINGTETLSFAMPLYVYDTITGAFVENTLWTHIINENKIRLIKQKKTINEEIHDFVIKSFVESREDSQKFVTVECMSYAIYELSKVGYTADFYEEWLTNNYPNDAYTINFWMNRVLPYTRNQYNVSTNTDGWNYTPQTLNEKENITGYTFVSGDTWTENTGSPIEKERIIKVSKSNVFNMLQELAEKFQVWAVFTYTYDNTYKVTGRNINFVEEVISDGTYTFNYGVNIQSLSRTSDSNDIVTKMYVTPIESEFEDDLYMNIDDAKPNFAMSNFLYNFDYYYNAGLMSSTEYSNLSILQSNLRKQNIALKQYQANLFNLDNQSDDLAVKIDFLNFKIKGAEQTKVDLVNQLSSYGTQEYALTDSYCVIVPGADYRIDLSSRKGILTSPAFTFKKSNKVSITPALNTDYFFLYDDTDDEAAITGIRFVANPDLTSVSLTTDLSTPLTAVVTSTTNLRSGMTLLENSNVPAGTKITSIDSATDITLSQAATAAGTVSTNFTLYRVYCSYSYNPYTYTLKLISGQDAIIDSSTVAVANLTAEKAVVDGNITTIQNDINSTLSTIEEYISTFESANVSILKEGVWEDSSYVLRKKINEITSGGAQTISHTDSSVSCYYRTSDLNNIDLDSIQLWKVVGGANTYCYSRYVDYDIKLGTYSATNALLFKPIVSSQLATDNPSTLYFRYKLVGTTQYLSATISKATCTVWDTRYFDITLANIMQHSLEIYSYYEGVDDVDNVLLVENTDYSLSTSYDASFNLKTRVTFKETQSARHYSTYPKIFVQTNESVERYYYDAVDVLTRSSIPNVSYNISVVDLSALSGFEDYRAAVGQKILIFDRELKFVGTEAFVSEIDYDLENPEQTSITISNYKTKFEDIFQRIVATTDSMRAREVSFDIMEQVISPKKVINFDILQNSFNENYLTLGTGVNNSVLWDENGITITDISGDSPVPGQVRIIGNGIFLSRTLVDGVREWTSAITAKGINASAITAGLIDTKKISIWNSNQIRFSWISEGLFAYGIAESGETDFNTFVRLNDEGLLFQRLINAGTVDEDTITELSLTWEGLEINGQEGAIKLTSLNGLQVFDATAQERIQIGKLSSTNDYGMRLRNSSNSITLETATDGTLWLKDSLLIGSGTSTVGLYGGGIDADIAIWAGSEDKNSAPFRIDYNGNLSAINVNLTGSINATEGYFTNDVYIGSLDNESNKIVLHGGDDGATTSIGSQNYASGEYGWKIDGLGNADFENITARGALKSTVFIYDEVNAQGGSLFIGKSGILFHDLIKTNGATSLTFNVKNTYDTQSALFAIGDSLKIQSYITIPPSITATKIILWLKVTAIQDPQIGPYRTYTADVLSSDPTTAYTLSPGTAIINYGVNTGGFILLKADDSIGPYIDIVENNGTNIQYPETQVLKVRLGDLSGISTDDFGSLNGYGLYSENVYLTGQFVMPGAGMSNEDSYTKDGSPIRIWAGVNSPSNRTNALFIVTENGSLYASNATLSQSIFAGDITIGDIQIYDSTKTADGDAMIRFVHDGPIYPVEISAAGSHFALPFYIGSASDQRFIVNESNILLKSNSFMINQDETGAGRYVNFPNSATSTIDLIEFVNGDFGFNVNSDSEFRFTSYTPNAVNGQYDFYFQGASNTAIKTYIKGTLGVDSSISIGTLKMEKKTDAGNVGIDFIV